MLSHKKEQGMFAKVADACEIIITGVTATYWFECDLKQLKQVSTFYSLPTK